VAGSDHNLAFKDIRLLIGEEQFQLSGKKLYHSYALDRIMYGTENPEKNKHLSGMNILALCVHFR